MKRLAALLAVVGVMAPAGALAARHIIADVPFVKQEPQWCGPAALESVLRYHGAQATQGEIAQEIALADGTVLNLDLKLYARRRGFVAQSGRGTGAGLRYRVGSGTPVICMIRLGAPGSRRNHFVVVYGYDDDKACFVAHSGERPAQEIPYLDFARMWGDGDNWMLVIRPRPRQSEQCDESP